MPVQTFKNANSKIQAICFEGGMESGMEICKWLGSGSAYIPETKTDPFDYVIVPTTELGRKSIVEGKWVAKVDGAITTFREHTLFEEYELVVE